MACRYWHLRVVLGVVLAVATASAQASPAVDSAVEKAKAWLYAQQKPDGSWEAGPGPSNNGISAPDGVQWGGQTALATYALLVSGESAQDPRLVKAIAFLKQAKLQGMYAQSVRMQVWLALPETPEIRKLMMADATAVNGALHQSGPFAGFYDYKSPASAYSLSRSQYGVLAMWAAAQSGIEIPDSYWKLVETAWLKVQSADGAWRYSEDPRFRDSGGFPYSAGITSVGVATLFLTQEYLDAKTGLPCKGNLPSPAIDKGLKWLAEHIDQLTPTTPLDIKYYGATLYAFERAGLASGLRYIGNTDWFETGSQWILSRQGADGSWSVSGVKGALTRIVDTSFCLLFLSRGRSPVVFGKLELTPTNPKEADWNQRPREIANLTRWLGRQIEKEVRWEVMNLGAGAKDLNDVPVLYISGSRPLSLTDADKAVLRKYVKEGGLILGHADCGNPAFARSFKALGASLFRDYEFRELPDSHPIYTRQIFPRSKWKSKPSLQGLSNGVRELMLLIPSADPGRAWQMRWDGSKQELWQLGANIAMYAVDKQPAQARPTDAKESAEPAMPVKAVTGKRAGGPATHPASRPAQAAKPRKVRIARLQHGGNWDPEPGGWRRLAALLEAKSVTATVEPVDLNTGGLDGFDLAHLTGTKPAALGEKAKAELKRFISAGGTLVIDAAGGNSAFATEVEDLLRSLGSPTTLPREHPLYEGLQMRYRDFTRTAAGAGFGPPRLQGIDVAGRIAVYYSRDDLSAGLVGQQVDGIAGYDPATATELTTRIVSAAAK